MEGDMLGFFRPFVLVRRPWLIRGVEGVDQHSSGVILDVCTSQWADALRHLLNVFLQSMSATRRSMRPTH